VSHGQSVEQDGEQHNHGDHDHRQQQGRSPLAGFFDERHRRDYPSRPGAGLSVLPFLTNL
jgi:hypothetical protein